MVNKTQESIYKEFYPRVLQYLSNRLNERQDAENLAHTVFLKVFTKIDLFDESKSSLSTWIFNITRNTLIDHQRSMTIRLHEEIPENLEDGEEGILEGFIKEEDLERLAEAMERLSNEERDLIVLHYYNGYPLTKISRMMQQPYGQIKRFHMKVINKLRMYIV